MGGAPVQCTRCGLVFTAQRPAEAQASQGQGPTSGTLPFGSKARTAGPIRTENYGKNPPAAGQSTQVFGAGPAAPAAPAPPGAGRTQVFGSGTAEPARTQVFGGVAAPRPASQPPPPARTQAFGGPAGGLPGPGAGEPPSPARTQVFGGGHPSPGTPARAPASSPPPAGRTQVFGGAPPGPGAANPSMRTAIFGGAAGESPPELDLPPAAADAPPGLRGGSRPSTLELPGSDPEPLPVPGMGAVRAIRPDPADRVLAQQLQRRNRRALWAVFLLLILAAAGWAGWTWYGGRSTLPAAARADRDAAFAMLRRDDPQSRAAAQKTLDALVARYPQWVGARATQALAQTLELDDQRALLKRGLNDAEQLKTQIARLEAERGTSDWKSQADAARVKLEQLRKQTDPLVDAVNALEAKLNGTRDALNRLPPGNADDELARVRADAVFAGVAGRGDRAIADAERYRQAGGRDGWGEIAYAEYALSAHGAPPESMEQAVKQMNELISHDSTFLRPYVLAGRLLLGLRQKEAALSKLDAAVALNPRHVLAQTLVDQERSK